MENFIENVVNFQSCFADCLVWLNRIFPINILNILDQNSLIELFGKISRFSNFDQRIKENNNFTNILAIFIMINFCNFSLIFHLFFFGLCCNLAHSFETILK